MNCRGACTWTLRLLVIAASHWGVFWAGFPARAQTETVLYNFAAFEGNPTAPLIFDSQSNLFGTT